MDDVRCFQSHLTLLLFTIIPSVLCAQEITGLELVKVIEHDNYSVQAVDCFFDDTYQLIAYSNVSSGDTDDTLVIYDFQQDVFLSRIVGSNWNYDIHFINAHHLLYANGTVLYTIRSFDDPVLPEMLMENVYAFTVSADKSMLGTLRYVQGAWQVDVANYDSIADAISHIGSYPIADDLDLQGAALTISPDNNYIALSGGYNNDFVYIINNGMQTADRVSTPANEGTYSPVFFMQDENLMLAVGGGYANGAIEVIDVESLSLEFSVPAFAHYNYSISLDSSREYVACGGYDQRIKFYRIDGNMFSVLDSHNVGHINQLTFTQDNQYVISAQGAGDAKLMIHRVLREPSGIASSINSPMLLFPNPCRENVFLQGVKTGAPVTFIDIGGKSLLSSLHTGSPIDISVLPKGLYFVKVENGFSIYTYKLMKY